MRTLKKYLSLVLIASTLTLLVSCKRGGSNNGGSNIDNDLCPVASTLSLTDKGGYQVARFFTPEDTINPIATYILVPKSSDIPADLPDGTIIRTPVSNLLVYSSVSAEALKELNAINSVKGVVDAKYFTQPEIVNGLKDGTVTDCGAASNPTAERVITMQPDAILLNIYDGMQVAGIDALAVPVIKMTDNYETSPLGRAEWIKFLGALTLQKEKADSIFDSVSRNYNTLRSSVSNSNNRPLVITDNMYQGVWYVPGGNSFQANLIADAGGDYFRKDDRSSGSLSLSFEEVLNKGRHADVWIIKYFGDNLDKNTLLGMDQRYASFSAIDKNGVYYTNSMDGAYFNDLVYHPDRLLQDYVKIFKSIAEGTQPENLRYFKPLGK